MSQRTKAWGVGVVCLVIIQMAASLLSPRTFGLVAVSDIIQFILLFSAAISCLPNILKNRGRTRLFWLLMGLGLTSSKNQRERDEGHRSKMVEKSVSRHRSDQNLEVGALNAG